VGDRLLGDDYVVAQLFEVVLAGSVIRWDQAHGTGPYTRLALPAQNLLAAEPGMHDEKRPPW
jgi:hypothetical protein